ncbi:ArfGap-domain-containing protein [Hesseltinella vesiculosa]|uniref:ArfGap-domain-containing protein n=1 Tax=Hesseltinella vesiculosa TaxID=101127 RepID=A0A1X2GY50_9FUNG|nr:ArfGap-domain-containing protein [Hesseltinella vesiculosa]
MASDVKSSDQQLDPSPLQHQCAIDFADDGPVFRATISQLENRTGTLKNNVKRLMKAATLAMEINEQACQADDTFMQALQETPSLEPLFTHFLEKSWQSLSQNRRQMLQSMQTLLLVPLQKLYDYDIKPADSKKRHFEETSKDYYASLAKYLATKPPSSSTSSDTIAAAADLDPASLHQPPDVSNQRRPSTSAGASSPMPPRPSAELCQSPPPTSAVLNKKLLRDQTLRRKSTDLDTKHQAKQGQFDLSRFDYYNYLMDLNGGMKDQEILYMMLAQCRRQYDFYQTIASDMQATRSGMASLANLLAQASSEQQTINKERSEKRRQLQNKLMDQLPPSSATSHPPSSQQPSASPAEPRFSTTSFTHSRLPMSPSVPTVSALSHANPSLAQGAMASPKSFSTSPISNESSALSLCLSPTVLARTSMESEDRRDRTCRRKEGFLFSPSKPSTSTWHKHWCVLSGGQLQEYSNWKRHLEVHNGPIDLRFATVREARSSDRRFVFEIITPQFTRMYQATSYDDMISWIHSITNAIEYALNHSTPADASMLTPQAATLHHQHTSSSCSEDPALASSTQSPHAAIQQNSLLSSVPTSSSPMQKSLSNQSPTVKSPNTREEHRRKSWKDHGRSISSVLQHGLRRKKHHSASLSLGDAYPSLPPVPLSPIARSITPQDLRSILCDSDPSNHFCADCQADNPEWCSINLGVIICIDCSGIHRSMGTHISKVRSLTLDTTSFTVDCVEMLKQLGNGRVNAILEATLTGNKKSLDRQSFIVDKYQHHRYVQPSSSTTPEDDNDAMAANASDATDLLWTALDQDDVYLSLNALLTGANVKARRPSTSTIITLSSMDDHPDEPPLGDEIHLPVLDAQGNVVAGQTNAIRISTRRLSSPSGSDSSFDSSTTNEDMLSTIETALMHPRAVDPTTTAFPAAELLIQNGAPIDFLADRSSFLSPLSIQYINTKFKIRGLAPLPMPVLSSSTAPAPSL